MPLGIAVAVGLLGTVLALRVVVLRPPSGWAPDLVAAVDDLRCRAAEAVVAAAGVMVAAPVFAVAFLAGGRLVGFSCAPLSWIVLGIMLLAVSALMLVVSGGCLVLLLVGPRLRPVESADTPVAGQAVRQ